MSTPDLEATLRAVLRTPEDVAAGYIAEYEAATGHMATEEDWAAARREVQQELLRIAAERRKERMP